MGAWCKEVDEELGNAGVGVGAGRRALSSNVDTYPRDEAENGKGEEEKLHVRPPLFHRRQGVRVENSSAVVVLPAGGGGCQTARQ